MSTGTVIYQCTYIILFLTQHNGPIKCEKNTIYVHPLRTPTAMLRSAGDVTNDYRVDTWKVMSNSLDINLIHGDIPGQLCENETLQNLTSVIVLVQYLLLCMTAIQSMTAIFKLRINLYLVKGKKPHFTFKIQMGTKPLFKPKKWWSHQLGQHTPARSEY